MHRTVFYLFQQPLSLTNCWACFNSYTIVHEIMKLACVLNKNHHMCCLAAQTRLPIFCQQPLSLTSCLVCFNQSTVVPQTVLLRVWHGRRAPLYIIYLCIYATLAEQPLMSPLLSTHKCLHCCPANTDVSIAEQPPMSPLLSSNHWCLHCLVCFNQSTVVPQTVLLRVWHGRRAPSVLLLYKKTRHRRRRRRRRRRRTFHFFPGPGTTPKETICREV